MSGKRAIRLPPSAFPEREIPACRLRKSVFHRLHRASADPILYTCSQSHRFSHPDLPYPVLYAGKDFETCAMEVFGDTMIDHNLDIALASWMAKTLTRMNISAKVCDLTDSKTRMACGIDLAAIKHPDLSIPQQWALAIAAHPTHFDGILYPSRFTGKACIALFDRNIPLSIQCTTTHPLAKEDKDTAGFLDKYGIRLV